MATTQTHPNAGLTRAAERYLEQYGEPTVMNTYLKIALLFLTGLCFMLGALLFKSQKALADQHPLIIRTYDVGRAEVVDYRNWKFKPQEVESKYYLTRWAALYFQRNRYTIENDQTAALYFMNDDVQQAVIRQEQKEKTIATFQHDTTLPYVDVAVKSISLDDLGKSPFNARIEFEKLFTDPGDHSIARRERWIASATFVYADKVKNEALAVNPLGLKIVRFRADQAFN